MHNQWFIPQHNILQGFCFHANFSKIIHPIYTLNFITLLDYPNALGCFIHHKDWIKHVNHTIYLFFLFASSPSWSNSLQRSLWSVSSSVPLIWKRMLQCSSDIDICSVEGQEKTKYNILPLLMEAAKKVIFLVNSPLRGCPLRKKYFF